MKSRAGRWKFIWGSIIGLLVVVLFFIGYCQGWWVQNNLLVQRLLLCQCPAATEAALYPAQVEIVVSACRDPGARLLPGGRLLYVREQRPRTNAYLLNLQTGEQLPFTPPERFAFLTEDLMFVLGRSTYYLVDLTDDSYYAIRQQPPRPGYLDDGTVDPGLLAELRAADQVFLDVGHDIVVALGPDFRNQPDKNFTLDRFDIPGRDPDRVEKFLTEHNVAYYTVGHHYLVESMSSSGEFVARRDGIFSNDTGELIVESYSQIPNRLGLGAFLPRGWVYDDSGVILTYSGSVYAIQIRFIIRVGFIEIPQPVLKLNVPENYLSPTH